MTMYKCKNCNEIYEIIFKGDCEDGACHECACQSMEEIDPNTADWKNEKHVPIVEKTDGGIKVTVGSTLHPMTGEHYITMIQVESGDMVLRKYLKPGDEPVAEFPIDDDGAKALEFCNIHGLWST